MNPYKWQLEVVDLFVKTKSVLLQAPPGAGKSYVATLVKERLGTKPTVIINSRDMVGQWKREYGMEALTIQGICNMPTEEKVKADVIILDEVHHYESDVWSQVYDRIDCEYLLGMSATPGEAIKRFDEVFVVPWGDITLPRFSFHYVKFNMESTAVEQYRDLTKQLNKTFKVFPRTPQERQALERKRLMLAMKRRRVCHGSENRHITAIETIKNNIGGRNLIICQTIKQSDAIGTALGVSSYHSKSGKASQQALDDFIAGKINTISSVNMLKEGFNCPEIDTMFIVSSALTDTHFVQLMGRALRVYKDKHVRIWVIIAKGTSDDNLVGLGESITGMADEKKILKWKWDKGDRVSVDTRGGVFRKVKGGREYYHTRPEDIGIQVLKVNPKGGVFRIYKGECLARKFRGRTIHSLGMMALLDPVEKVDYTKKITFDELFDN